MKTRVILALLPRFGAVVSLLLLVISCASTKSTEQMLSDAGFKRIAATTSKQADHLKTLPADRLTVAKLSGKTYYVFPDPAHNQIYVGNPEEYQTYQQIITYQKIEGRSRVLADLDQGSGDDAVKWVDWTSATGWTGGSY